MTTQMHIVFASDDNYVPYLGVAMMSVLDKHTDVAFHVLDGGITESHKEQLCRIANNITFYHVDTESLFRGFKTGRSYLSVAAFYRFLIPSLLDSNIERCLYLDCDTLVVDSLHDFYNTEFHGCYFAVVEDECSVEQSERLGFDTHNYFNSGVMLFNLSELRKFDFQRMCIDFYMNNRTQMFLDDQDVLNSLFVKKCKFSPLRYNTNTRVFIGRDELLCTQSVDQIQQASENPAIVHFTGEMKPWDLMSVHPLTRLYREYFQKLPWKNALSGGSYWRYVRYKLMASITSGKRHTHYVRKKDILHNKIRRVRVLLSKKERR